MADDEDFEEEEVWDAVAEGREEASPKAAAARRGNKLPGAAGARLNTILRKSAGPESSGRARRQTAPVSIPDWSKIYKRGQGSGASGAVCGEEGGGNESDDDDEDEDDDDRAPPHEWLAKKMARTQISSPSVCEGAGRTLKGRDLSKVRNAVLTKTGFLE
ncbi:hypothetical protein Cni_G19160 [Canna indica]|uniref:Senescence regulator n=1 Tax=Canna indica TaxID=4628 RepID=A0AAQ3KKN6_9LILI|nr:hypothetical protein Cni_G19160 [Canna indica]